MHFWKLFSVFPFLFFFLARLAGRCTRHHLCFALILWQTDTVAFRELVAPPMGRRGNAFRNLSSVGPLPCDSNLMSIGLYFLVFFIFFVKQAPPAKFGRLLRTNAMEYRNITWIPLSHRSRDHVCQFSWDLEKTCGKHSKKCVLKKIQNGGKSFYTQMGVAYLGRCVRTQGIQGKKNFDFPTYGSRVRGQNVKWAVIAPPWGRLINV